MSTYLMQCSQCEMCPFPNRRAQLNSHLNRNHLLAATHGTAGSRDLPPENHRILDPRSLIGTSALTSLAMGTKIGSGNTRRTFTSN